jgi:glycosyltransferase involved in cell wall biosynthesis
LYAQADIFAFPSIREFGGAVVLEAMAAGLPCIVADYGCPAEYVTADTGFKVSVASPHVLVAELVERLTTLIEDDAPRSEMSAAAVERARAFEWSHKAANLIGIYEQVLAA